MRVLVSGANGFVGRVLLSHLREEGHAVVPLLRADSGTSAPNAAAWWDPDRGRIDLGGAGTIDAVVHLAGENIASRWNRRKKDRIRRSRVEGTRLLMTALAALGSPPRAVVSASATGFYGSRGDEVLDENSGPGEGFLAKVARDWEAATEPAAEQGIRVTHLRTGIVIGPGGGAMARMLPIFKLGLGGKLGDGTQWWSWIALEDLVQAIACLLERDSVSGAVNAVAPEAVTNRAFTKELGRVLRRPTVMPVPAFLLHLVFGEMADEMFLASARVRPSRLLEIGFQFRHPDLASSLRSATGDLHS